MPKESSHQHQKVRAFLRHHPMGILSTVGSDGTPWGAAIYYVTDENFNFYFVTRVETFKYHNLNEIPLAALTIADSDSQTTVQLSGTISKVPLHQYVDIIFDKLANIKPKGDYSWAPPLAKVHAGNYIPLCLTPTKLQYANYGYSKSDDHSDYIEKIIPA